MKVIWFKVEYDVVTLTILFEITLIFFPTLIMVITLIANHQNECASGSKFILMNIGF